jgi:hypothetical protein
MVLIQNKEETYKYGYESELALYDIIKKYFPDDVKMTDRYDNFDFELAIDDRMILIELKTRTCKKDDFNTTFFPVKKLQYYRNYKAKNKDKKCSLLVCFGFPDESKQIRYYAIQYKPDKFNSYNITANPYDTTDGNINILIDNLIPIEGYLKALTKCLKTYKDVQNGLKNQTNLS